SMGQAVSISYASPGNLPMAMAKRTKASGLRSVGLYLTQPDEQQIQQVMEQQSQQPSPEEIKAKAAMELENVRTQGKLQIEQFRGQSKAAEFQAKMQADASKEREQRDADLRSEEHTSEL